MVTNDIDIPDVVDLSAKRRRGLSKKSIEINERKLEFVAFSKSLADKFTSGSALDFNVKVPSYIVPYLKRYDGSSFEALISLVLESVSFSYYSKLAEDFSISVFNKGIRFLHFPGEMLINNPVQEDTVSYTLLERVLDDYEEYLKFFYLDILGHRYSGSDRVSKIVDNSAVALKKLVDNEKKKNYDLINYYSDEIAKANNKYDILQKKYDDLYKYRSSKVQDLEADNLKYQAVILDLQNQIKKYDNLKYYYFLLRIPRFLRIFRFKLSRLKGHTWARHNKR